MRIAKDGDWPGLAGIGREAVGWGMASGWRAVGEATPARAEGVAGAGERRLD